jgi:hypothetical protein
MGFDEKSRAYDPKYTPTKTLEQLVVENPGNQFMADRLAERKAAEEKAANEGQQGDAGPTSQV